MESLHSNLYDKIETEVRDALRLHFPNQTAEFAISFPVIPGEQGPQVGFMLIMSIPSLQIGEMLSTGATFPAARPNAQQVEELTKALLNELTKAKDLQMQSALGQNGGHGHGHSVIQGQAERLPRFDVSKGLPPV